MKFDIVTPSYNQARHLKETIESVLSQTQEGIDVDYYILDGGSRDGSAEIIKSYASALKYWRSEKDKGQTAAIAEGLGMGNGDIIAWINSDDFYPAGVFKTAADFFSANPEIDMIYGDCLMTDENSSPVGISTHVPVTWQDLFETPYLINQEATFFRRKIYEKVAGVDPTFWGAMDYDLWLRMFYEGTPCYLPRILGVHRFMPDQKSSTSNRYVEEMKYARRKLAEKYSLSLPTWPFSKQGMERLKGKWSRQWEPVTTWIEDGCKEEKFTDAVSDLWRRYSASGVLCVQGGTSFNWVGPEVVYVLDKRTVGQKLRWDIQSPYPGLSADRVDIFADGIYLAAQPHKCASIDLALQGDNRFSVVKFKANKSFVPALENWGPAYFSISFVSMPFPMGKAVLSVQSIPCFPSWDYLRLQETGRSPEGATAISGRAPSTKRRPLKVAFFSAYPASAGSGSEHLIYNTVRALTERGHDARVYVMNTQLDKNPPFFVHKLPTLPLERILERIHAKLTGMNDFLFPSTALLRFRHWLRAADIWHFHNLHAHYLSIPLLGLLSRTKHIVLSPVDMYLSTGCCPYPMDCKRYQSGCGSCPWPKENYPGIARDATRALWRIKYLFVRLSRLNMFFHTRALNNHYANTFVKPQSGRTIRYGVDVCTFRPLDRKDCARRLRAAASSRFVVGLFHSYILEARKGILPIIKRLGELSKQFPAKIELLVVGNQGNSVREIVPAELKVTMLPYLRHPHELANALNLCDVLLYPTQAENMSLTCLNALACGVPVITYDAGGQREAIKNDYNGYVVDIHDQEGMILRMEEIIKNPDLRRRLSEGARQSAEEDFDFERYIDELIEYYRGIIGGNLSLSKTSRE